MEEAVAVGEDARGTASPNPAVGAVVLDRAGEVVGRGSTAAPGGPHAEVTALAAAGPRAAGGTAVVTLEPCDHTGRTGPCSQALLRAGVRGVVYLHADPSGAAAGGAATLRRHGVAVTGPLAAHADPTWLPVAAVERWLTAVRLGRPHVTVKTAGTLDGLAAATDGTSQWITGPAARGEVHRDRARRDAVVVGTGTVLADDPRLTARRPDGTLQDRQPLRVVVGTRDIPPGAALATRGEGESPVVVAGTRDLPAVLADLHGRGVVDVLVEGGPRLTAAVLAAGLVDEVDAWIAPALLGAGLRTVAPPPGTATTIGDILRLRPRSLTTHGGDLRLTSTVGCTDDVAGPFVEFSPSTHGHSQGFPR
ncbi:bifunctional diaminohydroxyphosphoribosylaminopyrimidine deaminase/5-amino-6-(5-phosphoribosylamino)uracil reductase RibD [Corynebacterium bovis]|uniref:bifunctional diaminohydroxyphosphoribosylaminopyrimidine deaminase/5-amino-6-(5-phosphoribosylamino)uracil reductase RibD n=1 Tax=Corynebacterium bovis TaxID=36808 RepID=UPI0031386AA1